MLRAAIGADDARMGQPKGIQARVGPHLAARRKALLMTQADVADKADVEYAFVGRLERGEAQGKLETWETLAAAVGLRLSEFVRGAEESGAPRASSAREPGLRYGGNAMQLTVLNDIARKLGPRKLSTLIQVARGMAEPGKTPR